MIYSSAYVILFFKKKEKENKFQLLKCEYLIVSLLLHDNEVNIFGLWTRYLRTSSDASRNMDKDALSFSDIYRTKNK